MNTQMTTPRNTWNRALRYLSTETDAAALPANTRTQPASVDSSTPTDNKVVIPCTGNLIKIAFIGTDAANETVVATVYEWRKQVSPQYADAPALDYASRFLLSLTATLGAKTGIATGVVTNSEFYADTIVVDGSPSETQVRETYSPANDNIAWLLIDPLGADYLEVQFDLGTAASAGVMWTWL